MSQKETRKRDRQTDRHTNRDRDREGQILVEKEIDSVLTSTDIVIHCRDRGIQHQRKKKGARTLNEPVTNSRKLKRMVEQP